MQITQFILITLAISLSAAVPYSYTINLQSITLDLHPIYSHHFVNTTMVPIPTFGEQIPTITLDLHPSSPPTRSLPNKGAKITSEGDPICGSGIGICPGTSCCR
ncbi:hypothetical protein AUEXF2481DRAFT_39685 [Aureobasidium subglaciale EXF-2481]|uniref:Hydrophobin n=1 Tax=Aureobasidium subglaciale (strain EXF-2481) TaxID=1043005 RepID=A0A074YIC6_AURSE|nr:uncharacterized protein AUEXF2481DRAFT_39685 [Aureobasidium subglaciale EXF-2481]KEQ95829.1 hypothetical protein AUEXF2481DRAFT_39685 [Aureobasidium subglaciale EXF-2481]